MSIRFRGGRKLLVVFAISGYVKPKIEQEVENLANARLASALTIVTETKTGDTSFGIACEATPL